MDFSDVDNASSDVGAEVSEVENKDVDFGDGDGVNDFDETYNEMNSGGETLEYAGESEKTDSSAFDENKSNDITEESVNDELEEFDDLPTVDGEENLETGISDDSSISRSEMTTDESVEDTLADFEDDSNSIVEEDAQNENIGEEDTGVDDVKESDANLDEEGTEETDDTEYETGDSEAVEANDETDNINEDGYSDAEEGIESSVDDVEDSETQSDAVKDVQEDDTSEDAVKDVQEDDTSEDAVKDVQEDDTSEVDVKDVQEDDTSEDAVKDVQEDDTSEADVKDVQEDDTSEADVKDVQEDDTSETDVKDIQEDDTSEVDMENTSNVNMEDLEDSVNGTEDSETSSDDVNDMQNDDSLEDAVDDVFEKESEGDVDSTDVSDAEIKDSEDSTADWENTENISEDVSETQEGDQKAINENGDNGNEAEKTAIFENVSYHQGQNDIGALGTCGPTSIANSLNRITGTSDYSENAVLHNAMDNNLCHKSDNPYACGGTTTKDVVNIIDNVKKPEDNIHTEVYEYDKVLSVDDLANRLDDPGTVAMVGVDSATLWDQRGDVSSSGLFQHTDTPSDHWITVDSPIRDESGNLTGFNVIDSGGGVSEVSREKFESIYTGDAGHTISDPTAILISNISEGTNTFVTSEGVERTSNYKGSAVESDGGDPPSEMVRISLTNSEKTASGVELNSEQREVNDYFRGDKYSKNESFEGNIDIEDKSRLIEANCSTTCGLNDNLNGSVDNNAKYSTKMSEGQIESLNELKDLRDSVPEITDETVMQKVITPDQFLDYTRTEEPKTQVTGCASRAEDVAPYTNNMEQAYENLRLDYQGTPYKDVVENGGDMYVMRFTSDYCPSNDEYPRMDGSQPWNKPPCTGSGFTGSAEHLIPEYTYGQGQDITDGAIYKVDASGNETMVAMWKHDHFERTE